jgi:hypothetical protein
MGNAITVTPGAGFTSATATLNASASDAAGFVTFTTAATIPASPYKLFTLQWGGSWQSSYATFPVVSVFACANPANSRTAAQEGAVAALGPFYVIPNALGLSADVYCTNAPAISTAYDIGYAAIQGP